MKKKILFIHHATGWGGAPINMINIIKTLNKTEYNIKVLLIRDSIVSDKLRENNIDFEIAKSPFYAKFYNYYTHSLAGYTKWYQFYRQGKLIICWLCSRLYFAPQELKKHKFDIVHLNSSVLTDWLAPAKKRGKVIYHIQEPLTFGAFGLRYRFFRHQVQKYADSVIAISADNAERINLPLKTVIVHNFSEEFVPTIDRHSYTSKMVLYVGGDEKIKGYYTLIDALDYIDNDIKVLLAGNFKSVNRKRLKDKIKLLIPGYRQNLLLQERALHKIEYFENVEKIGLLDNINSKLNNVCLLVSPFAVEHFSRPIIEAFAHQKCVIATNLKGMQEVVKHNYNGLLVEVNNPLKLANAINFLAKNPELCEKFGKNGYDVAIEKYSSKNVSIVEEVYSRL